MTRFVSRGEPATVPYQYLVLHCVPRVDRGEFVNVGVVVYCERAAFLSHASRLDGARLTCLWPELDLSAVAAALDAVRAICEGHPSAGLAGSVGLGARFGHLAAPRSTVVQPGPVHGGLLSADSPDPRAMVSHLLDTLVLVPPGRG